MLRVLIGLNIDVFLPLQKSAVMKERVQLTKNEIIMGFIAQCVEAVADTLGVDNYEVYWRMYAVK